MDGRGSAIAGFKPVSDRRGEIIRNNTKNGKKQSGTERKSLAKKGSDLRSFTLNSIQNGLESRLAETALNTGLFIIRESLAQPLRAVVEGVPEWLVDTLDGVSLGHEDLSFWQ